MSNADLLAVASAGWQVSGGTLLPGVCTPSSGVCGTGYGSVVLPGDPSMEDPILSATSTLVGIRLWWTYPNVNPGAVAYTNVYRGTTAVADDAGFIGIASGGTYLDHTSVNSSGVFYYWIQMVSVNGTIGPLIGPASAAQLPTVDQLIDILEGRLEDSTLAAALRTKINTITDVSSSLTTEEQVRLLGDDVLSQLMAQLQTDLAAVDTLVQQEVTERVTADSALVARVDFILAQANDNAAAILTEQAARATADQAIALDITTVQATAGAAQASAQTALNVSAATDGTVSAMYTVRVDVNGFVSGFGLSTTGAESEFIVRANRFAIGFPGESNAYPFIVDTVNGVPVIALNAATFIPDASITNAKIGASIQSDDYAGSGGTTGWAINKNGFGRFNNLYARGNIEASSLTVGTAMVDTLNIQGNAVTIPVGASGGSQTTKQVTVTYTAGAAPSAIIVSGSVVVTGQNNNSTQTAQLSTSTGSLSSQPGSTRLFETSQQYTIPVFGIVSNPGGSSCTISLSTVNGTGSSFSQLRWNLTAIGSKR